MPGEGEFDESKHPRDDHGRFGEGGGGSEAKPSMRDRMRPGGDLHERAKASLQDRAFVEQHAARLDQAAAEAKTNFPGRENSDDANHAAQANAHAEAMRIHHEQDTIGGNPYLQRAADDESRLAQFRREDLETQHASVMNRLSQNYALATNFHQQDLDSQSRGFANRTAEQAHHQSVRDADSQSRGFANQEAERAHLEAEKAKADRAAEDKAIAAGHVSSEVRDAADRYVATDTAQRSAAEGHAAQLDRAHHEAAEALAVLHAYGSKDHEGLDTSDFRHEEEFHQTQSQLHEALGLEEHSGYEKDTPGHEPPTHPDEASLFAGERYEPFDNEHDNAPFAHREGLEHVPHPDSSERDLTDEEYNHQLAAHEAWKQRAEAVHGEAMAAHQAEFQQRAETAQTALERLHQQQLQTHEHLKSIDREGDKAHREASKKLDSLADDDGEGSNLVNHEAFAHHERDYGTEDGKPESPEDAHDPQYLVDDKAREDYESAHAAANTMFEHATSRLENHSSLSVDDALQSLKEEMRSTRDSIKALGKITGRAPSLPQKPGKAKKSANRPAAARGATVRYMAKAHRLTLRKLDFLSLVDVPAQETADIRLIKRGTPGRSITARIHKVEADRVAADGTPDPLIWCWAFTATKADGTPYQDLQDDVIQPDFIRAAEEFMRKGGAVDQMHDSQPRESRVAFAFPWDQDIATAMLGPEAAAANKTVGLMVAIRPTAEQLELAKSGKFGGVSIAGSGIREAIKSFSKSKPVCKSCGGYMATDDTKCAKCGTEKSAVKVSTLKAVLSTADKDSLPDRAFLYIEPGGTKDDDGKTTPRSLRHFPYRDAAGTIDIAHLRAACSDIPKSSLPADKRQELQRKAETLLGAQHDKASKRLRKQAVLTSAVDGHQHQIDLDDPADAWNADKLSTSFNTAEGATYGHSHAWIYDATGKITIASDSGHTHTVDAVVPPDVIRQAQLNESGERCSQCGCMCESGARFCPQCGCAMASDGTPNAPMSDDDSESGPSIAIIELRAPEPISTLSDTAPTVDTESKEQPAMDALQIMTDKYKDLEKRALHLEKLVALSDAQRAYHTRLVGQDADVFLNKSNLERELEISEFAKADEIVYTSPITGEAFRKSCNARELRLQKQADDATLALRAEATKRIDLEFATKGAEVLSHIGKGAKGNLAGRVMKAISAEFTDRDEYEEVLEKLRGLNEAMKMLGKSNGVTTAPDPTPSDPAVKLETLAKRYAEEQKVTYPKAYDAVLATPAGAALYAQIPTRAQA